MKISKKYLFRILVLIILLLTGWFTFSVYYRGRALRNRSNSPLWEPKQATYQFQSIHSPFVSLWAVSNTFAEYTTATQNHITIIGSLDKNKAPSLIGLHSIDGRISWENTGGQFRSTSLMSNQTHVFAGFTGKGKVIAIDARTGDKTWEWIPNNAKNSTIMSASQSEVQVRVVDSSVSFSILDTNIGNLIFHNPKSLLYVNENGIMFKTSPSQVMQAVDVNTGRLLWDRKFNKPIDSPLFTNDSILVREGRVRLGQTYNQLYALDQKTGNILWQYEDYPIGNMALGNSILYAINAQSQLLAIELISGSVLGTLQFTPKFIELDYANPESPLVTAYENQVFVYTKSGRQLFALEFSP
ncbi:MAG: PQQ-binding-like beta-propeller repeat protein [Gammaproteobacteria bacterium]|nr:PQQ-binding-like beta-propeller repeat protein [Gammaproteobacteria bacterium]